MAASLIGKLLFYPLLALGCLAIAPLLKRGGKPVQKDDRLTFPTRPGMRAIYCLVGLMSIALLWLGLQETTAFGVCFFLGVGVFFLSMAVVGLSMRYSLDSTGVHYLRLGRDTTISWDDLDHYESAPLQQFGAKQIYLRGRDGTTIGIADIGIDSAAFMSHVKAKRSIKERPYVRRHWWGG